MLIRPLLCGIPALVLVCGVVACLPPTPGPLPPFPAEVPDSVPEWVYADSNLVVEDAFITGIYPRGILVVVFTRTSTVEERGELTRSINAEVIGGHPGVVTRAGRTSDWYFLRLRGDRSSVAMEAAREKLENSPHVEIAMFDFRVDLM
jgi:hypothetical protein